MARYHFSDDLPNAYAIIASLVPEPRWGKELVALKKCVDEFGLSKFVWLAQRIKGQRDVKTLWYFVANDFAALRNEEDKWPLHESGKFTYQDFGPLFEWKRPVHLEPVKPSPRTLTPIERLRKFEVRRCQNGPQEEG